MVLPPPPDNNIKDEEDCDNISCDDFNDDNSINTSSPIKVALFLFILFIAISSDVFIEKVMGSTMSNGRCPNSKGIITQGLTMSCGFLFINYLVDNRYV